MQGSNEQIRRAEIIKDHFARNASLAKRAWFKSDQTYFLFTYHVTSILAEDQSSWWITRKEYDLHQFIFLMPGLGEKCEEHDLWDTRQRMISELRQSLIVHALI